MLGKLQEELPKFLKIQLDNQVDLKKCCKTRICLQRSVPIQPKTSNILPKFFGPALQSQSLCAGAPAESPARGGPEARALQDQALQAAALPPTSPQTSVSA